MKSFVCRQIKYDELGDLIKLGKKERVTFDNPDNAYWFGSFDGDKIVGCVCVVINPKTKTARFKSDYVRVEYRRLGVYSALCIVRMNFCIRHKVKKATAFCTPKSIGKYLADGFAPASKRGDITFVEKKFEY